MQSTIRVCRSMIGRRLWVTLACVLLAVIVAISINVVGIRASGAVAGWEIWLEQHRFHFFLWRLCLYGATVCGWWWMRKRVLLREPDASTQARLYRVESAGVIVVLALETTTWLQAP